MDKISASELFKKLIVNSQYALASEDEQIKKRILECISGKKEIHFPELISILGMNNEYMRISMCKTIVSTLCEMNIIEKDIDILDTTESNKLVAEALPKD